MGGGEGGGVMLMGWWWVCAMVFVDGIMYVGVGVCEEVSVSTAGCAGGLW